MFLPQIHKHRYTYGQSIKGRVVMDIQILPAYCAERFGGGFGGFPGGRFARSSVPYMSQGCSFYDPVSRIRCGGAGINCRHNPVNPGVPICVPEPSCPKLRQQIEVAPSIVT